MKKNIINDIREKNAAKQLIFSENYYKYICYNGQEDVKEEIHKKIEESNEILNFYRQKIKENRKSMINNFYLSPILQKKKETSLVKEFSRREIKQENKEYREIIKETKQKRKILKIANKVV